MKERPIIFSAPMVRAILDGRKTQTRRIANEFAGRDDLNAILRHFPNQNSRTYGQPGDRLWVRETGWERPERTPRMMREGADTWDRYYYDADGLVDSDHDQLKEWGFKRRPSIHMPRWASRILLDVTAVRVERLQDISEADCIAEGAVGGHGAIQCYGYAATPQVHYRGIWESINGAGSWKENPWVWVISFNKV